MRQPSHADLAAQLHTETQRFTDYHVGMLAWHKEGGADWDLDIAERTGIKAMAAMAAGAPPSARAVVNIQGDFLHWDASGAARIAKIYAGATRELADYGWLD